MKYRLASKDGYVLYSHVYNGQWPNTWLIVIACITVRIGEICVEESEIYFKKLLLMI